MLYVEGLGSGGGLGSVCSVFTSGDSPTESELDTSGLQKRYQDSLPFQTTETSKVCVPLVLILELASISEQGRIFKLD
jgi:hypothetical protein